MKRVMFLAWVIALAGCAMAPPKYLDASLSQPDSQRYVVTIERSRSIAGNSVPLTIFVDGQPAADISGGQAMNLYLLSGRHIIGVALLGNSKKRPPDREIAIDVSSTHKPILRAGPVALGYGGFGIERVE